MSATESRDDVIARGADVPLQLAKQATARDALLDPQTEDIIPDDEEKGYHVGETRQPAEPVLTRGGDVRFESDRPSKFPSFADQKAELDARQAHDPAYAGVEHRPLLTKEEDVAKAKAAMGKAPVADRSSSQTERQAKPRSSGRTTRKAPVADRSQAQPRSSGRTTRRSSVKRAVKGPSPAAGTVDVSTGTAEGASSAS